jgi:hypothetical protein
MDDDNDHLVYPNLINCHIATTNSSSSSSLPPSPPSASSIFQRIEASMSFQKPSLERYKFTVEREVVAKSEGSGKRG